MQESTPLESGRGKENKEAAHSSISSTGFKKQLPLWVALLAASLVCQAVSYWVHHANFEMVSFADRIIRPDLLRGGSLAPINAIYGFAIVLAIFGFLVTTRVLLAVVRFDSRYAGSVRIRVETRVIGMLSAFTILLQSLSLLEAPLKDLDHVIAVMYAGILFTLFVVVVQKALVASGDTAAGKAYRLPGYSALMSLVLFCTILPFAYQGFLGEPCWLGWAELLAVFVAAMMLTGLYAIGFPWVGKRLQIGKARFDNLLTIAFAPLMLLPIALPLSNEFQFSLSGVAGVHPRAIWAILCLLLIVASICLTVLSFRKRPLWRASKLVKNYYFPTVVLTSTTFVNFDHFLSVGPAIDMFHWGELVVPVQQWYEFHRIPFVDLLPTHGLRDVFIQLLYTIANGYRGLEMLLWSYWLNVAAAVLFYLLIVRVFSPLFALVLTVCVPLCNVFTLQGPDYCVFIVVALCVYRAMETLTVRSMTVLWIAVSCAFWWRYDVGLLSMASCVVLMVGFLRGKGRHEWKIVVLPACVVALVQMVIFGVVAAVHGRSAPELVMQLWYHLKILSSGHGFGTIWPAWNPVTFLMYCMLPTVCVGYLVYFLHQRLSMNRPLPPIGYMLVFLATISLMLSFRNLHRHGLMESYKSLFAVFLVGSIPVLAHVRKRITELSFLALILLHAMVLGSYSWLSPANAQKLREDMKRVFALQKLPEINFKAGAVFSFHQWHAKETRLRDSSDWQYRGLKPFLDSAMTGDQTFFDLSCGTLLYALTDREVVSFILQGQVHTGEPVQRYQLARMRAKYEAGGLPFVIFKRGTKWDVLDGVPSELRSYLMTEFIYRHYRPLGYVGSFQMWIANTHNRLTEPSPEPLKIPLPLRKDYEVRNAIKLDTENSELSWRSSGQQSGVRHFVDPRGVPPLDKDHYWFLRLVCRSSGSGQCAAYFVRASQPGRSSVIGFSAKAEVHAARNGEWQEVIFRIPISTLGKTDSLADIILNTPPNVECAIRSAEILCTANPLFPRISHVEQRLDFGTLPQMWAEYDKGRAWEKTKVLGTKQARQICEPGKDLPLTFGPVEDKETGNYLQVTIQSDHATQATVVVPGEPESWITFQVKGSPEPRDYVIRISCLWAWMKNREAQVTIRAQQPIWVQDVVLRKGD